eukprot:TRINITY_DN691_c0_g1_i1.p1 TRINITY_DN691_c0_g1~~TRINITY_DN691_c0_g1_i1.p1  ORF type:complete len:646 (-),score=140.41 TRINITY_DN691_c0_g1_i1:81-2018(-)
MMNKSFDWEPYYLPNQQYSTLHHTNNTPLAQLTPHYDFTICPSSIQSFARDFLEDEQTWMVYKNASIKVSCDIKGPLANQFLDSNSSFFIWDEPPILHDTQQAETLPMLHPVLSLYLVLTMVRDLPSSQTATNQQVETPMLVQKLSSQKNSHSSPQRIQVYPPQLPTHPQNTNNVNLSFPSAEWAKLQFTSATSGNGKSKEFREYFRIVISLAASFTIVETGQILERFISSVIAPPLIVIGQNPARFKKRPRKDTPNLVAIPPSSSSSTNLTFTPSPTNNDVTLQITNNSSNNATSSANSANSENSSPSQTPSFLLIPQNPDSSPSSSSSYFNSETTENASTQTPWTPSPNGTGIYRFGSVGINMSNPPEALSVGGNILVGGNIMKPSDERIKENIVPIVNTSEQLQNIKKLRMYNYDRINIGKGSGPLEYVPESGFIAQEVKKVVPKAVHVIGDVTLSDGTVIPQLLVVDDRVLLLENIGATQELGKIIDDINEDTQDNKRIIEKISTLVETIQKSESTLEVNSMKSKFNLFGLGPAWSVTVLGFFFPFIWACGIGYMFSSRWLRQLSGLISLALFGLLVAIYVLLFTVRIRHSLRLPFFLLLHSSLWILGFFICTLVLIGSFFHNLRKKKQASRRKATFQRVC